MITEFLKEYLPRETSTLLTPLAIKDIMDPRQPQQHPFSRNTSSPFGRTPFPPAPNHPNQAPFPPSSQPPPGPGPSYGERQRRPSEPPAYYNQQRYGQEGPSMSGTHSRHQSASSVGHGTPVNRMPPPSSPQQPSQQGPHHSYGPQQPRGPPVSLGPPSSFTSSRELPALPPPGSRPPSNGGSMSILRMLDGSGPSVSREAQQSQYTSPVVTSGPPNSMFGSTHASPRMTTTASDYAPFRRPQTPEHQRTFQTRDHRANSAGSPPNPGHYSTPESQRFGTPQQAYQQRVPLAEERREPIRVPNPNAMPPRPNSQPAAFNGPPPRIPENSRPPVHNDSIFGRRVENAPGPGDRREPTYGRPAFEERHNLYDNFLERAERDRQQERVRDAAILREREIALQRERDMREQRERAEHESNLQREYAHQVAQRNAQAQYNRQPDPREHHAQWMRPGYEHPRPSYEPHPPERPPPQQAPNGYEYPATTGPRFESHPAPAYASNEPRYGQAPPSSMPPQHNPPPASQYEASMQERQRLAQQHEHQRQQLQQQQQAIFGGQHQNGQYQNHESPARRPIDEPHPMQQNRNSLAVQEINRRGRISPLPQPVQGAQGQSNGQSGEPSIKNEFGRMFSGIGSGVGAMERAMSGPSPIIAGPQIPFSNQLRREDLESLQDSPGEGGSQKLARTNSRGGRRRKLKEEDGRGDDESSTGRQTPSGRGKRAKIHHHHHHHQLSHHHRTDAPENTSSPLQSNLTPFKSIKGSSVPSPPSLDPQSTGALHHHHVPTTHHHHVNHVTHPKPSPHVNTTIPLPKTTIRNNEVLDSVANLPRKHLGHAYYKSTLKPTGARPKRNILSDRGFASTPEPLPRFEGSENCTFTIRIPRIFLSDTSREEITARKALWGTDIYTDDSDIIAACIHQGWFKGAWPEEIDTSLLGLELDIDPKDTPQPPLTIDDKLISPPKEGPWDVPKDRDLHVTIIVLPALETYFSKVRFGLKSRPWGGKTATEHDGLSFMIHSIQWVTGVDWLPHDKNENRIWRGLDKEELEEEGSWTGLFNGGSGSGRQFEESFERGGRGALDITGIGMKSWWQGSASDIREKGKEKEKESKPKPLPLQAPTSSNGISSGDLISKGKEKEKEKEKETDLRSPSQEQEHQIEMVTERMIHNAHSRDHHEVISPMVVVNIQRERVSDEMGAGVGEEVPRVVVNGGGN